MTRAVFLAFLLASCSAWAGDEFQTPELRSGSGYESATPEYRVVGIQDHEAAHRLWVVAPPAAVLKQSAVNRIISDIQRRNLGFTEIYFYSSVGSTPKYPAFRITDLLATYYSAENKTHFKAKELQGGWAHGPRQ